MKTHDILQALRQTTQGEVSLNAHAELNLRCLTALERILSHVLVQLDGNPDAPLDSGDVVECVHDALLRAQLLPTSEPAPADETVLARVLREGHDMVLNKEKALLATRGDGQWITLELGETLNQRTRAGRVLGRLLGTFGDGPWYIVASRPGTPRTPPMKVEHEAAERIAAAARLVDLPLAGVYLDVRGGKTHTLVENSDG